MNMYTVLTPTFMYGNVLVMCLLVHVLGLTLTPLLFQQKDSEIHPRGCAVILFSNLIIVLHGLIYQYGIDSFSAAFAL